MKFGKIVRQVNTHGLTESNFWYDIILSGYAGMAFQRVSTFTYLLTYLYLQHTAKRHYCERQTVNAGPVDPRATLTVDCINTCIGLLLTGSN